jgi:hypothetical protein
MRWWGVGDALLIARNVLFARQCHRDIAMSVSFIIESTLKSATPRLKIDGIVDR